MSNNPQINIEIANDTLYVLILFQNVWVTVLLLQQYIILL